MTNWAICVILSPMNKITIYLLIIILSLTPKTDVLAAKNDVNNLVQAVSIEKIEKELTSSTPTQSYILPVVEIKSEVVTPPKTLQEVAKEMVEAKFGEGHFEAFSKIVDHESGWNPNAINPVSGACGLGQALPCSKLIDQTPEGQLKWMVDYISERYQTPSKALAFWNRHAWY